MGDALFVALTAHSYLKGFAVPVGEIQRHDFRASKPAPVEKRQ